MHPEKQFKSVVLLFFTWVRVLVGGTPLKLAITTPLEGSTVKNLFLVICARLEVLIFLKKWREIQTITIQFSLGLSIMIICRTKLKPCQSKCSSTISSGQSKTFS